MVNGNAVHALGCARLVSHRCPDRWLFDMLNAATTDGPAAVTDAAEMAARLQRAWRNRSHLRRQHRRAGHRGCDDAHTGEAVTRFTECAEILRATTMSNEIVISCPVVGSTTLAVIAEVALLEATVHLLDLALVARRPCPDPTAAIEVLAWRADPAVAMPAIR